MSVTPVAAGGEPRLDYVTCASRTGLHRMAYWEWGDPANDRVLLCVHGLTRTGRDFDVLARRLAGEYRVVCPDVVGRGQSDWLSDGRGYVVPQYVADMLVLIARLRPARLDWVGTSMGGLIGLGLAGALALAFATRRGGPGQELPAVPAVPLGRMVLNDIGPVLSADGLGRIGAYVGQAPSFETFDEAVAYVRSVSADFGPHDEAGWRDLTRHVFLKHEGRWVRHSDPRLAEAFADQDAGALEAAQALLWQSYASLPGPVLILRGQESDLFSAQTAADMLARHPQAQLREFPGVGHAPTLRSEDQVEAVVRFLLG